MLWIVKLIIVLATFVNGQLKTEQPIVIPEPAIVQEENQIVETQVIVQTPEQSFRVVEYTDSDGVSALIPDVPVEDNWSMFWALNPELLPEPISLPVKPDWWVDSK